MGGLPKPAGLAKENPAQQVLPNRCKHTIICFARETVAIVDNLGINSDQRNSVSDIVAAIQQYVDGQSTNQWSVVIFKN